MKKFIYLGAVGLFIILLLGLLRGNENSWICENGQWIKHGHPRAPMPSDACQTDAPPAVDKEKEKNSESLSMTLEAPLENQVVGHIFAVKGRATGDWFFEGSFPVKVILSTGEVLTTATAQSMGEWMTSNLVPFQTVITLDKSLPINTKITLLLKQDDPQGQNNVKEKTIPLVVGGQENMIVKVYFNNNFYNPDAKCDQIYPVDRVVEKQATVGRAALEQLLAGPTPLEATGGFTTALNQNITIKNLTIENGTANVEFSAELDEMVGGSCRVIQIRNQIEKTLMQFSTIKKVIINSAGKIPNETLQP